MNGHHEEDAWDADTPPRLWEEVRVGERCIAATTEMQRAIGWARLNTDEQIVPGLVQESVWAGIVTVNADAVRSPDAGPCRIDLSALAQEANLSRRALEAAEVSLIASHILVELADGALTINEAYREWIFPATGQARFSGKLLRFVGREDG